MKHPSRPDTQPDEYIADLPTLRQAQGRPERSRGTSAHRTPPTHPNPEGAGINPVDTSSMPRAEDDEETFRHSPEFNDRPDAPKRPDR